MFGMLRVVAALSACVDINMLLLKMVTPQETGAYDIQNRDSFKITPCLFIQISS